MANVLTEQRSCATWDSAMNAPGAPVLIPHFRCSACPYDSVDRAYVESHVTGPHPPEPIPDEVEEPEQDFPPALPTHKKGNR